MNIIAIAAAEAVDRHAPHKRKYNGGPYIYHPMRVAGHYLILAGTEDGVAASWLHDVPEDVAKDAEERDFLLKHIAEITSERTAAIVLGLTDPCKFDPARRKLKRDERKKISREFLSAQDNEIKRIKMLDRIDNLTEMVTDMHSGVMRELDFAEKYTNEAELLGDVLKIADGKLYDELMDVVRRTRNAANLLRSTGFWTALKENDNPNQVSIP
jgi:(p)ppGpp synthase/HD superfamily hydrolase